MKLIKNNLSTIIVVSYFLMMGVLATAVTASVPAPIADKVFKQTHLKSDNNVINKNHEYTSKNNNSFHDYKKHPAQLKKSQLTYGSVTEIKAINNLHIKNYKSFYFHEQEKQNAYTLKRFYHYKVDHNYKHQF